MHAKDADVIACDLDGTLAKHDSDAPFDPEHIGAPVGPMLDRVKAWLEKGDEVVIFTARAADKKNIPPIRAWLEEHGLGECKITNEKSPEMEEFWDDRAVAVESNTGVVKDAAALMRAIPKALSAAKAVVPETKLLMNSTRPVTHMGELTDAVASRFAGAKTGMPFSTEMIHGTNQPFKSFSDKLLGSNTNSGPWRHSTTANSAHFLTDEADAANYYANMAVSRQGVGNPTLMRGKMELQNPLVLDSHLGRSAYPQELRALPDSEILNWAKNKGHDGVIYKGMTDAYRDATAAERAAWGSSVGSVGIPSNIAAIFNPESVKFASVEPASVIEGFEKLASIPLAFDSDELEKNAIVEQRGDKWVLLTKDKSRVLGTHNSAREAYGQEYAIQKSQEKNAHSSRGFQTKVWRTKGLPHDLGFWVGGDRCMVDACDWHTQNEISVAMNIARQYFTHVEEGDECGKPRWATKYISPSKGHAHRKGEKDAADGDNEWMDKNASFSGADIHAGDWFSQFIENAGSDWSMTKDAAGMKCPNCGDRKSKRKIAGDAIICQACNKASDMEAWDRLCKKADVDHKFPRPENYTRSKTYSNDNMDVGIGGNDWDSSAYIVGIHAKGALDKEPPCWFTVDHSECKGCRGKLDAGNPEDLKVCQAFSHDVIRDFFESAGHSRRFKDGEWAELNPLMRKHDRIGKFKRFDPKKSAAAIPTTGPDAIVAKLRGMDLDSLEREHRAMVKSGKVSKRARSVKILGIIEGMRRNETQPHEMMINKVPVIPAVFRPFTVAGSTFIPGDANELYRDLFTVRGLYRETQKELGPEAVGDARLALYNAVKATYGFGDPVNPKTLSRGVTGFFQKITGTSPKFSYVQRKLLSKPQDNVSRGTATINPDLGLDEIGVPEEWAWTMYKDYVQKRLVNQGYSPADAIMAIRDRSTRAKQSLDEEVKVRPAIYSRAPAWHKFNSIAGHVKLTKGNTLETNPFITAGMNLDFDGDALNVHIPASPSSVKEAYEKLMPSKMVFSIRDPDKVMPAMKHEQILSLYAATQRPAKQTWKFGSEDEAMAAIRAGNVPLADEVHYPGVEKLGTPLQNAR